MHVENIVSYTSAKRTYFDSTFKAFLRPDAVIENAVPFFKLNTSKKAAIW